MNQHYNHNINVKQVITGVSLIIGVISVGVIGYILIENYTFVEALYMTIITVSTVGFEVIRELSDAGMIFTVFLIIISLGVMGFFASMLTRHFLDGIFKNYYKENKVKRKISKLENHVIVCGYGRVGRQVIQELQDHKFDIVIIDNDEVEIENIRKQGDILYLHGDATHDDIMEAAQIGKAQSLITTLPKDADNLFVVLSARGLNPKLKIISRASEEHSDTKLKRAGATNIIMPDRIGGQRMAKLVIQPDVVEFLEYILLQSSDDVNIEEISCELLNRCLYNKTIGELGIRNKSGANIIGLKDQDGKYVFNPSADIALQQGYQLFVLGSPTQLSLFRQLLKEGNCD